MSQTAHTAFWVFFLFFCFYLFRHNLDDQPVSSSFRGLTVRQQRQEPPAGSTHLLQDLTVDLCDLTPPVVHFAVSTSPSNPTSIYSHLPPRHFPNGSVSNAKPLSWEIPKDSHIVTRGLCSGPGESRGKYLSPDPAGPPDGSRKVEGAEVENSPHMVNPHSPLKSDCQPDSPAESSSCSREAASPLKVRNWKKYKFIVLNSAEGDDDPLRNSNRWVTDPPAAARRPLVVQCGYIFVLFIILAFCVLALALCLQICGEMQ